MGNCSLLFVAHRLHLQYTVRIALRPTLEHRCRPSRFVSSLRPRIHMLRGSSMIVHSPRKTQNAGVRPEAGSLAPIRCSTLCSIWFRSTQPRMWISAGKDSASFSWELSQSSINLRTVRFVWIVTDMTRILEGEIGSWTEGNMPLSMRSVAARSPLVPFHLH